MHRIKVIASLNECDDVSRLHIASIKGGILPLLGQTTLSRIYFYVATDPNSIIYGAYSGASLLGYVAATTSVQNLMGKISARLFFRHLLTILREGNLNALCHKLLAHLNISILSIGSRTIRGSSKLPPSCAAELLAIAVNCESRNKGIGKDLIQKIDRFMQANNTPGYRVRTNKEDAISNIFYLSNGFKLLSELPLHTLNLNLFAKIFSK